MKRLIASLALAPALLAQPAEKLQLSLKKAVELALAPAGNERVQLARELVAQSKERVAQARAALLPNVDGAVSGQNFTRNLRAFGLNVTAPGFSLPSVVGPITNFDARANAQWTVFDFAAWRRLDAARQGVAAADADRQAARNQVADAVARAYLAALRANASLAAASADVDVAETLRRQAITQKDAGTGTGIEVVRADSQLAGARQRRDLLINGRKRAYLSLLRLLDLNLDAELELTDPLALPAGPEPSLADALTAAKRNRPDLEAQRLRVQIAKTNYSATKWERLPSIQAFGDYGAIGLDVAGAIPTRTYGATLRIPLFDGGRRDSRRAEAGIVARQEEIRSRDTEKQAELDVRLALDSLHTAAGQVTVSTEALDLANRELEQAQRRYTAGVTTSVEVVDAQARLERARENQVLAQYELSQARIDLATAMGAIDRILQ